MANYKKLYYENRAKNVYKILRDGTEKNVDQIIDDLMNKDDALENTINANKASADESIKNLQNKDIELQNTINANKKALDDKDNELENLINANKKALDNKDNELQNLINANKEELDNKDNELENTINTNKEELDNKDTELQNLINANKKALDDKDNELQNTINANKEELDNKDNELQNLINANKKALDNKDTELQNLINANKKASDDKDTELENLINANKKYSDETFIKNIVVQDRDITAYKGDNSQFDIPITPYTLGLEYVDNTHDKDKVVAAANKLVTPRQFNVSGAVTTNTISFDGTGNVNLVASKVDATKLEGIIPIENIPASAIETLVKVANKTARFALTTDIVQRGDTVKELDTGFLYLVVDETKLNKEEGYEVYTAESAATVPWTGVTGKPSTYTPSAHTQDISTINGLQAALDSKSSNTHLHDDRYLKLSGGTMTGDIGIPISRSSIDGSVPYAGSAMSNISSISSISSYKTYLGTYTDSSSTWYNIISIRHRNGNGDGSSFGMYLRSTLTSSGNLLWGKQYGGNLWQDERVILDSSNYTSYTVKKDGTGASGTWGINVTGNAATANKLATARTISLTGSVTGSGTFDGSGNLSIATTTNHTHNSMVSRGNITAESGAGRPAVLGLSMSEVYNNGYPTPYGNVISLKGSGDGQILVGWAGTSGAHAPVYVRSKRDVTTANWSDWAQFYTTAHPQTNISGNAATATKLATARTISLTGSVTGSGTFDGSGNLSISTTTNHTHNYAGSSSAGGAATTALACTGNAATATKLATARTISLTGSVTGSGTFDGSGNLSISTTTNHTHNYAGSSSAGGAATTALKCTGNAATATKLATARTISLTGSVTGSGTFDGSGNLSIATTTNHTHNYAGSSSAGGTANSSYLLSKNSTFNSAGQAGLQYYDAEISNTSNNNSWSAPSAGWHQILHMPLSVSGYFNELAFPVNDTNGLAWRQRRNTTYSGWFRILDTNNYTSYTVKKDGTGASGTWGINVTGNAATATKLATARNISINGTSKSFDGSAAISFSASEIGLGSYLPLSGGTMTGDIQIGYNGIYVISGATYGMKYGTKTIKGVDHTGLIIGDISATGNAHYNILGQDTYTMGWICLGTSGPIGPGIANAVTGGVVHNYLTENYLPLSGGTMIGNVQIGTNAIYVNGNTSWGIKYGSKTVNGSSRTGIIVGDLSSDGNGSYTILGQDTLVNGFVELETSGTIASGNTRAVTGGTVYDYLKGINAVSDIHAGRVLKMASRTIEAAPSSSTYYTLLVAKHTDNSMARGIIVTTIGAVTNLYSFWRGANTYYVQKIIENQSTNMIMADVSSNNLIIKNTNVSNTGQAMIFYI